METFSKWISDIVKYLFSRSNRAASKGDTQTIDDIPAEEIRHGDCYFCDGTGVVTDETMDPPSAFALGRSSHDVRPLSPSRSCPLCHGTGSRPK